MLVLGDIQEEFHDLDAGSGEMALMIGNRLEALLPERAGAGGLAEAILGQALPAEEFRVDPHHQHLLIIGAVMDADAPTLRQGFRGAPEEIMVEFLR